MSCDLHHRQDACFEGCPGWGVYNGDELHCCGSCGVFDSDWEAAEHVMDCADCMAYLEKDLDTEAMTTWAKEELDKG